MGGQLSSGYSGPAGPPTEQRVISLSGNYAADWGRPGLTEPAPGRGSSSSLGVYRTAVVQNPVSLKKRTFKLLPVENNNLCKLTFNFDAKLPAEVRLHLAAVDKGICPATGVVVFEALGGAPKQFQRQSFPAGQDLTYSSPAFDCQQVELLVGTDPGAKAIVVQLTARLADGSWASQDISASLAESHERGWTLSPVTQKILFKGRRFDVQEIYGLDRSVGGAPSDDHLDPGAFISGRECVICLSEDRTTAVLPCRHLCLCSACADIMRVQSNKCPICRQTVTSLLQISPEEPVGP